jgi:hypothetical protein
VPWDAAIIWFRESRGLRFNRLLHTVSGFRGKPKGGIHSFRGQINLSSRFSQHEQLPPEPQAIFTHENMDSDEHPMVQGQRPIHRFRYFLRYILATKHPMFHFLILQYLLGNPIHIETASQMHACPIKYHPTVCRRDVKMLTDFFGTLAFHFAH